MTGLAIVSLAATAIGTGISAYSAYQEGKAAKEQAQMQAELYEQQAAENRRQAQLENERAGIAQLQGEQEAAHRSRALAAEIGHNYAEWAGNGLLVDRGDTFGNVLKNSATEAAADISTIRDNTAMNVWTHQANAASYRASAANNMLSAESSLLSGRNAAKTAKYNALGTALGGIGKIAGSAFSIWG